MKGRKQYRVLRNSLPEYRISTRVSSRTINLMRAHKLKHTHAHNFKHIYKELAEGYL